MKRKLIHLFLATALTAVVAVAQDVSLRADHPDEYVVVEGDTLWDIASRYLDQPWQWPAIWKANPQVQNPHLIYPGDVLSLAYLDGAPRLAIDPDKSLNRLSPEPRVLSDSAIRPIPHSAIEGFIRNIRNVTEAEYDALPYVVQNAEGRRNAARGDDTFVRGISEPVGHRVSIMRRANIYLRKPSGLRRVEEPGRNRHAPASIEWHPGFWESMVNIQPNNHGEVVGIELYEVAEAVVAKSGDPAILRIVTGQDAVREGDVVMPIDDIGYVEEYVPHAMDSVPQGLKVLAVQGGNRLTGHQKMVSINGGRYQGIEPGHVFSAFQPGEAIQDRVKYPAGTWASVRATDGGKVVLPDQFDGHIMVIRVFNEVSYALIMNGERPVREFDVLKHPSETL